MRRTTWNMLRGKRSNNGFTLIEAIIGMFVFTVGILGAMSMQISALNGNSISRSLTQAANIAANQVEDFRSLPYLDKPGDADFSGLPNGTTGPIQSGNYAITYRVQRDAILRNTMRVDVTVNWLHLGAPKSMNLVYIKYDLI